MAIEPLSELKKICWKETETVWYAKYVIRHFSIRFTRLLLPTGISANQATFIFLISGMLGCVLLGFGSQSLAILGVILIQASYVFDCVDGEIARYNKQSSVNGVFIDSVGHVIITPLIFFSMTMFMFNNTHQVSIIILGIGAMWSSIRPMANAKANVLLSLLQMSHLAYYDYTKLGTRGISTSDAPKVKSSFASFLIDILSYPASMNIVSILSMLYFYSPIASTYFIKVYFGLHILIQIYLPIKWYRQNSVEKDFLSLRDKVLKTYKDQKSQKS
ncbi:MAG: CDP-alcohol phosphatidyltransferase family protein [Candidatus Marinimicrobia bacterium]|nr:CDP-alcohol phosphatidyltransferase family protein [Candidatus Neomarinimicrobiota bacterium]